MDFSKAVRYWMLIAIAFMGSAFAVNAQLTEKDRVLEKFERDIESGKLAQSEKPVSDYAFAHPTDARAMELLARLRLKQGRFDEAMALYKRVIVLDPELISAKVNYATALLVTHQPDAAVELLKGIDPSRIKDLITRLDLAQAQVLAGNCDQALAVAAALPIRILNTDALALRATCYVQLYKTSELEALVPVAKKVVTVSPNAVMRFADVLISAGRIKPAIEILQLVLKATPANSNALQIIGKAEIVGKDFASARRHLEQAAALDPRSPEITYLQAQLEVEQGHPSDALPFLKKTSEFAPNTPDILAELALTAIKANKPADAEDAAEKLLALKPDDPESMYLLGAAALQGGNLEKARSNLERYMLLKPNDGRGCVALGLAMAAQKDQTEAARRQLRHCIDIDPANVEAIYQMGLSYKAQGDTVEAIRYLEQTVNIAPKHAIALRDLGTVYLQAGNEPKAREMLERSAVIDPEDAEIHFQLSRLYNLIGEAALAKQHFEMFQKIKNRKGQ